MINTVLNVDDICQDCPYFSVETNHISCEHHDLCKHLRKHIEKEMRE